MTSRLLCFLELRSGHDWYASFNVRTRTVRVPRSFEKQGRLLAAILRFAAAHGATGVWTED